jgi:peptide/nickel transport system substrate-binding protein
LPIFQDRRVRQALLYAIDRDAIVTGVFAGQALRADSPLNAGSWAYSDSLRRYGTDANIAASLLSEAGWNPTDRGTRARGGVELAFKLAVNSDPVRVAVANDLAARWSALGVRVTVETLGTTSIVRDLLEPRSFESVLFAQVVNADPDPYPVWHSTQTGPKGANLSLLRDARIDRVLEEARLLATPQRRGELYAEFQELFAQEVPAIPLYVSTALYAQQGSLQGVRLTYFDNAGSRFWQVHEWYLRTR